jgi:hypothetical protein
LSSNREEYLAIIEGLKQVPQNGTKRFQVAHVSLILALEERIEKIDAELAVSIGHFLYHSCGQPDLSWGHHGP